MAWDPGSSAWDWETDGAIVPGHLTGLAHCKLSISGWEGESKIKQDRPALHCCTASHQGRDAAAIAESSRADLARNGDLCNQVVTPAMANISSSLVFHDAGSPSDLGLMLQARVPIVTTCLSSGVLLGTYDHASESLESVVQMQYGEIHGNAAHGNAQNNAHGGWSSKTIETEVEQFLLSGKQGLVTEVSGRDDLFTSEYESAGSLCNGRNDAVIDEQHSSSAKGSVLSSDSPTGLQLGKRTYPLDVMSPVAAKTTMKSNGAGKKPRGSAAASQVPRCQVEGCKLDLSSAKDYHRRHKVCEPHSKAGKVVVASLEQRFCQQCSRCCV